MVDQTTTQTDDPMDAAMSAEYTPRARVYFGEVAIDTWFCALVKGTGKVLFDPNVHSADRRCTAIKIGIAPLTTNGTIYEPIERELIAESKDWASIVKPSLREINADLRSVNGKWAQVELVPTGRTYKNKSGEEKQATTFKFLSIFDTEAECEEAANLYFSAGQDDGSTAPATTKAPANGNGHGNGNGNDAEKATAAKFLPALWAQSGHDAVKFGDLISRTAPINKYFTIESPEVMAIIAPF